MPEILPRGLITHKPNECGGEHCVLHNPSDHHMSEWTIYIRLDREFALAERLCPHGIGHPDPDSLSYIRQQVSMMKKDFPMADKPYGPYASDVHGCDGCCRT